MATDDRALLAQGHLLHAWFLGLQLMVTTRLGNAVVGDWIHRLFRRQHHAKFLSSFDKLGLSGLPHAVACARYHVLSNDIGGVAVQYMEESDTKAWVRFRYPRWMYAGPAICGLPIEVSRGFLTGWYAHNGMSLGNPRLGFVCVSEDMTGDFGFCGYFQQYDHDLAPEQRLRFAPGELPPPFDAARQPVAPAGDWSPERLKKAARNYALEYLRNGLVELANVVGADKAREHGELSARLIGLQYYAETAARIGAVDGSALDAAGYVASMLAGMGDDARVVAGVQAGTACIDIGGVRGIRGPGDAASEAGFSCWRGVWGGAGRAAQFSARSVGARLIEVNRAARVHGIDSVV